MKAALVMAVTGSNWPKMLWNTIGMHIDHRGDDIQHFDTVMDKNTGCKGQKGQAIPNPGHKIDVIVFRFVFQPPATQCAVECG